MTPERWQKIEVLLQEAMECEPGGRDAFLASACGGDDELRREVESLLSFHDRSESFIETPPYKAAAELFDGGGAESLVGRVVGDYKVERELGRGGMGEVYLARDTRLGRPVALKLLPALYTTDSERVRRFRQEARSASALNHPNILTIYEVGEADGLRFIATEYVEGETLRALLAGGGLTPERALDVAIQTACALAAAHDAGIVHRDVKPENVMVRPDGYVKVLDFGLAKLVEREPAGEGGGTPRARHSTNPGIMLGTISYMSPEQARGQKVDARSDIFSLGVVLYECVAGRTPFEGETQSDILVSILSEEPPPLAVHTADAPGALQVIIDRALRKDREGRYQTVGEMLGDLQELKRELEVENLLGRGPASGAGVAGRAGVSGGLRADGCDATPPEAAPAARGASTKVPGAWWAAARGWRRGLFALALAAFVAASVALAAFYFYAWRGDSVAVLPFTFTSPDAADQPDPDREYISDGLTESIIQNLSQLPRVKVIAHSSVLHYKGKEVDLKEVGRALNVRTLLTGRIVQRGAVLNVSAELVDVESGAQLWGDRYEARVSDLLRVQREVAGQISGKLRVYLTGAEPERLAGRQTANPDAYQHYLKGRYFLSKRTGESLRKALEHFRAAIALDQDYALAYAGVSDAYGVMPLYTDTPVEVAAPQAREAARRAVEKGERLAEAHAAMGFVLSYFDWDQAGAERAYARAIALNPNYALARRRYGLFLAVVGRFDEGLAELRRAEELEPLARALRSTFASALFYARRYAEAEALLREQVEMFPESAGPRLLLGDVYRQQGRYAEAVAEYRLADGLRGGDELEAKARLALVHAVAGDRAEALRLLEVLRRDPPRRMFSDLAAIHAALGDEEQAFHSLEESFRRRHPSLRELKVDPRFDSLRDDARFAEMVRRVGLEP